MLLLLNGRVFRSQNNENPQEICGAGTNGGFACTRSYCNRQTYVLPGAFTLPVAPCPSPTALRQKQQARFIREIYPLICYGLSRSQMTFSPVTQIHLPVPAVTLRPLLHMGRNRIIAPEQSYSPGELRYVGMSFNFSTAPRLSCLPEFSVTRSLQNSGYRKEAQAFAAGRLFESFRRRNACRC